MTLMNGGVIIRATLFEIDTDDSFQLKVELGDDERAMLEGHDLGIILVAVPKEEEASDE